MKKYVILLVMILLVIGAAAQNNQKIKELQKLDFNKFNTNKDKDLLEISPLFKNTDTADFLVQRKNWLDTQLYNIPFYKPDSSNKQSKLQYFSKRDNFSNMPIARPGGNYWNMPIAVPDSSVNYAIKQAFKHELIQHKNPGK